MTNDSRRRLTETSEDKILAAARYSDKVADAVYVEPEGVVVIGQLAIIAQGKPIEGEPTLVMDDKDGGEWLYWVYRAPEDWADIDNRPRMVSIVDPIEGYYDGDSEWPFTALVPKEITENLGIFTVEQYDAWMAL